MNVLLNKIDPVNAVIKIEVEKADYQEKVEKALRAFRAKASIPGFRKGMAPIGMLKKMHGKAILVEELNKLISDQLYAYIKENNLSVLGEPLPSEEYKEPDLDNQENFEFTYDIALAPEFTFSINKRDKVPYYSVIVDDEMVNKQIDSYRSSYGTYKEADVAEAKDMLKGTLVECENGQPKEGGLVVEDAVLMPSYIKDESEQAKFIGAAKNSVVTFNPTKAYEGAEVEIASLLKIKKEEIAQHTGDFNFEILSITRYTEAEMNQELFDRVLGANVVSDEEAFKAKVKEMVAQQFVADSDYKFMLDVRVMLEKKVGELTFPDAFLKRWVLANQQDKTPEAVDAEYPAMLKDLKFHLIKEQLVKMSGVKIEEADLKEQARKAVKMQFAQYGMMTVPDDVLNNYAAEMLKKKESVRSLVDAALEEKLTAWLKDQVKLDPKEVSYEDFKLLFQQQ
ncbi:MAG: trigger factor [Bacteroidales bacterium]|nr:trigger factor [Bacteroidales bacterium]